MSDVVIHMNTHIQADTQKDVTFLEKGIFEHLRKEFIQEELPKMHLAYNWWLYNVALIKEEPNV